MTTRATYARGQLLTTIVVVMLLGAVAGALWAVITPTMGGRIVGPDSAVLVAARIPDEFGAIAVFALVIFGYGMLSAAIAWIVGRAWRGPAGFVFAASSAFLGALLAAWVGTGVAQWRTPDPRSLPVGASFDLVPDLWLSGAVRGGLGGQWVLFLTAPCAVALVYLVCALLARDADLGVGDKPSDAVITSADVASRTHP